MKNLVVYIDGLGEIRRRIECGSISAREAANGMQAIIDGKAKHIGNRCTKMHRAPTRELKRLPINVRKRSLAPLRLRTNSFRNRLYYAYKANLSHGKWPSMHRPDRLTPEDVMALMWEAENIPGAISPLLWGIFDGEEPSQRDIAVASSTLQWLGTNVGKEFLCRFIATADINVS